MCKGEKEMNYEKCINKIIEFSKRFYNSLDFAHNMEHGEKSSKKCKKNCGD